MKKIMTLAILLCSFIGAHALTAPVFPGGDSALKAYISDNMKYPVSAKDNGIEGVVGVMFVVRPDGSIGNIKIKRMVDPDLESEAIRLVKNMPKWTPADENGTPVESPAEVDIQFTLD
ncbi:MAG: energy transducer TonB [Muribaculaceae bacterium]|nr:energy transducer TonB [Muribaculaceae bacterium]